MGLESLADESCSGGYNPEQFGAQCSKCYLYKLRQGGPVPPEINPGSKILIAAEGPGEDEVKFNRPLVGKSGMETIAGLATVGLMRSQVSLTNCFVCRPPGNNLDALLLRMKKENKERAAQGLELYLSPMEACRPRFIHELRLFQDVISLGKPAFQSLTGTNQSIFDARGMPLDGVLDGSGKYHTTLYIPEPGETVTKLRVLPTMHPAFVLRKKRWRGTFRVDLSRAVRWFAGDLQWKEPQCIYQPSPQQLEEFLLKERHPLIVYDVETGSPNLDMPHLGKEPLLAKLRCIGFSTTEFGMVVPFLSVDGVSTFYPSDEQEAIDEICRAHFLDSKVVKVGHNIGYYDRLSIETNLGVTPAPIVDTILLHRGAESELPHKLGYVGTTWTNVTKQWKTEHTAITAKTDKDLWDYNFTDDIVTARIFEPLMQAVAARNLTNVVAIHHELQGVCAGMHRNGLFVDQARRKQHDVWLQREAAHHRQVLRQTIGEPGFNPNSRDQVGAVLFERWGLTPEVIYENDPSASKKIKKAYTAAGAPSTGDDNLRAMLLFCPRNSEKWTFINSLRKFRGAVKLRGTNIIPLRPIDEPYYEGDDLSINLDVEEEARSIDEWDDSQVERDHDAKGPTRRLKLKEKKPGLVLFDGRVHPHWNAHTATTQRFASNEPNGQNWSRKIRDIVHAQQMDDWITTHIMVGGRSIAFRHPEKFTRALIAADMDQLELRFASALAGAARYLEVFAKGGDPHAVTCEMLYGDAFKHASEEGKKRLRDFAKRFAYACAVGSTPVAVLDQRGVVPIRDAKPGDWTWCWDGHKYVPTRIRKVRNHGVRPCVKITYKWRAGKKGWKTKAVVFTPDHLFMLRDGSYREAGHLQPGDALMPFNRWRVGSYRVLDQFNDGGRIGEHRAVVGAEVHSGGHVHHEDGNEVNNTPKNLKWMSEGDHAREHWEVGKKRKSALDQINRDQWSERNRGKTNARLTAGRVNSTKWRTANKASVVKMRAGLEKARLEGRVRRGLGPSKLDSFRDKVGVLRDREVARMVGVTPEAVSHYRRQRGIPAPPGQRVNHEVVSVEPAGEHEVWDLEVEHESHNFAIDGGVFVHNCLYKATVETIHETLASSENDAGELVFPDLTLRETRNFHERWMRGSPEFGDVDGTGGWWLREMEEYRRQGYLTEPIFGWRRDFLDGEEDSANEIVNFKSQAGGSAVVHLATLKYLKYMPFGRWGPGTGLVQQGHDALMVEVPATHGPTSFRIDKLGEPVLDKFGQPIVDKWCPKACKCPTEKHRQELQEAMTVDGHPFGLPVVFTASGKAGFRWSEV